MSDIAGEGSGVAERRLKERDHGRKGSVHPGIDRELFVALFDRYFGPLVNYAERLTGHHAAACDVVQDVFVKLWERRHRLEVHVSVQAMLYTMVRNRSLNERRKTRRMAADVPVDAQPEMLQAGDDIEELRSRLCAWIGELPARRREAFMLSRFHDLSHSEIAEIMGISERTVDTHILLALRSLRERLERMQQEE